MSEPLAEAGERSRGRGYRLVLGFAALLAAFAAWRVARTTLYMVDSSRLDLAVDDFSERHWCATAYLIAADLALRGAPRPYDPEHYRFDADERRSGSLPGELGRRFDIDSYPYPPQFLLLPATLLSLTRDPDRLRAAWYFVVLAVLGAAILASAAGHPSRGLALVVLPAALLASHPVQQSLQVGNVQPLVVACAVLGAWAFAAGRAPAGGCLLALAIVTKAWPAALLLLAAAQRRWSDVAWTLAWIGLFTLLTLAWFGWYVFAEFFGFELAWILDGRAFPFIANGPADNLSIPALAHKLNALGIGGTPSTLVSRPLSICYGALLALLLVVAGQQTRGASRSPRQVSRSLAAIGLAQLASPFLASSLGLIAAIWLLLGLCDRRRPMRTVVCATLCLACALPLPEDVWLRSAWTLMQMLSLIALGAVVLLSRERGEPQPAAYSMRM